MPVKDAFEVRLAEIRERLQILNNLVDVRLHSHISGPDWGDVGSASHLVEILQEALDFYK